MKKLFLVLLIFIYGLSANAYEEYYVPNETNPSFTFYVMYPGEYFGDKTSEFVIPYDYVFPLLKSAENWREKISPVGKQLCVKFLNNIFI